MSRLFSSKPKYSIKFILTGEKREIIEKVLESELQRFPIYKQGDNITGRIEFNVRSGKKIDHQKIRVDLIGRIEVSNEPSLNHDFFIKTKKLSGQGTLTHKNSWDIEFKEPELEYETYIGNNVKLTYFLQLVVIRSMLNIKEKVGFWVIKEGIEEPETTHLHTEVGIKDVLHIDFTFAKTHYHLNDVVIGRINFYLSRIKLKHMEVCIIRKETVGVGATKHSESEVLQPRYQTMDGAPVRGDSIPVRLFLKPYEITPTFKRIDGRFSVRYLLNLVLVDEHRKKYFKQKEITLYRKKI